MNRSYKYKDLNILKQFEQFLYTCVYNKNSVSYLCQLNRIIYGRYNILCNKEISCIDCEYVKELYEVINYE